MDFEIPSELTTFVDVIRRFREEYLAPLERDFLLAGNLDTKTWIDLQERGRERGLWALDVPEEQGGAGLGELAMCLVVEELYKSPTMFEFGGCPEPALNLCNDEQRKIWFDPIVKGELRCCFAFTEPGTGSDFAGITTTATRDGSEWVLNGRKTFISHVERSDFVIVFASTDRSLGSRGVSCFLVANDTPGYEVSRPIPTMGDGWEPYELTFSDCRIPAENLLGEVGEGWAIGNHQLSHGRLRIAAYQLGIAQQCLDLAIEWAKERKTWGQPLASRQAIQWMVADSHVELEAARLLVYRAASLVDRKGSTRTDAFVAKLYATEMSGRVTDRAMQIFGGLGYSKELAVQSFYRQARLWRIGHGTSEIHRWMIAREILGPAAA